MHLEITNKDLSSTIRRFSCQYLISKRKYKLKALCHVRQLHHQLFNKEKESSIFSDILLSTLLPEKVHSHCLCLKVTFCLSDSTIADSNMLFPQV